MHTHTHTPSLGCMYVCIYHRFTEIKSKHHKIHFLRVYLEVVYIEIYIDTCICVSLSNIHTHMHTHMPINDEWLCTSVVSTFNYYESAKNICVQIFV